MSSTNSNYDHLTNDELLKLMYSYVPEKLHAGFYQYRGYTLTKGFSDLQESIEHLEVYDSDIWVTSSPKSGTTWLSEAVWSICNQLNTEEARQPLAHRVPFLEVSSLFNLSDSTAPKELFGSVQKVIDMPPPRIIKSHLAWECLPAQIRTFAKRPRVIHVARDLRDAAVSCVHFFRMIRGYSGPAELYYEAAIRGLTLYSPHEKCAGSYWSRRNEENVLFLTFEDMKKDLRTETIKIADFLKVEVDDKKMAALLKHLSFGEMKRNVDLGMDDLPKYLNEKIIHASSVGQFFRKGEAGSHKDEMSIKMAQKFDDKMKYKLTNL